MSNINHRLYHNFRVEVEPNGSFIHSCLQGELVYCQIVSELYITFSNELKVLLGIVYIRMISPWMYEWLLFVTHALIHSFNI